MSEQQQPEERSGFAHFVRWIAGNLLVRLADAAGDLAFWIRNSDDTDVFTVQSNGDVAISGDLSVGGSGPDHGGLTGLGDDDHMQYLLADGTRILTGDWDIGDLRKILADVIRARDAAGLLLQDDGGKGIFIEDGGQIGIGTASPATLLEIEDAAGPVVTLDKSGTVAWRLDLTQVGQLRLWSDAVGTALLTLDNAAQRVGIRAVSPGTTLDVAGDFRLTSPAASTTFLTLKPSGSSARWYARESAANEVYVYATNAGGTEMLRFSVNGASFFKGGNVGIGTDNPGAKLHVDAGNVRITGSEKGIELQRDADQLIAKLFFVESNTPTGPMLANATVIHSIGGSPIHLFPNAGAPANGLTVAYNGKVGVGTTGPGGILDLADGGGRIVFNANRIERWDSDTDAAKLWLNWAGYNGGTTRFRDTVIGNGKQSNVLLVQGSTGRVGIGTLSPANSLEIEDAAGPVIRLDKPGTVAWHLDLTQADQLRLWSDAVGTALLTLDHSDQKVGIGTVTPEERLDVGGGKIANSQIRGGYYRRTSIQNIPENTWTQILYNTVKYQTSGNDCVSSRIYARESGYYMMQAGVSFGTESNPWYMARFSWVDVDLSVTYYSHHVKWESNASTVWGQTITFGPIYMDAGDYAIVQVFQTGVEGAELEPCTATQDHNWFSMYRVA